MKNAIVTLVILTGMAAAGTARAQQPQAVVDRPGFDLGFRLGYALPFGNAVGGPRGGLDTLVASLVPLTVDAGYRINRAFTAGLFFQYAIMQINTGANGCAQGMSCSGYVISSGGEGLYHLPVPGRFVPWIGLGAGYEWLHLNVSGNAGQPISVSGTFRGAEFGIFQLGGDYRITPDLGLGPFLTFSVARYDHTSSSGSVGGVPMSTSMEIADKAVHEWLEIGVRGRFSL